MGYLIDSEVLADVHNPAAQAGSSSRLRLDVVCIEVRVGQEVLLALLDTSQWNVVFVKGKQRLQEGIHIPHELLARIPADILLPSTHIWTVRFRTEIAKLFHSWHPNAPRQNALSLLPSFTIHLLKLIRYLPWGFCRLEL